MNEHLRVGFAWGVTFALVGCAMSAHEVEDPLPMPQGWELRFHYNQEGCWPIEGVFKNVGMGTFGHQSEMTVARLDAALGRAMVPSREPKRVEVSFDVRHGTLAFRFLGGEQPYEYSVPVECEQGWLTWRVDLRDHYLGDGVSLERSSQQIRLRESSNLDLIVHSRGEAVYSSAIVLRTGEATEWWSKFPRIEN